MSGHWIVTLVPPAVPAPRAAVWAGHAAAGVLMGLRADSGQRRARDVRRTAREVEREQPDLARELRGIAMHEASLQARLPKRAGPMWLRAAGSIAGKLTAASKHALAAWRKLPKHFEGVHLTPAEGAMREAAEVRRLAHSYSKSDPGFAADLYAAAERHERAYLDD